MIPSSHNILSLIIQMLCNLLDMPLLPFYPVGNYRGLSPIGLKEKGF